MIERSFEIETKDLFEIDFDHGLTDASARDTEISGDGTFVSGKDGLGYLIGGTTELELSRGNAHIHALDTFGISFDMRLTDADDTGTFLRFYKSFSGSVDSDGRINFAITTDNGKVTLQSDEPIFVDTDFHHVGIAFDGVTGQLALYADGEMVAETEAFGQTAAKTFYGLNFGAESWETSVPAVIDNVVFSADPAVAGKLPNVAPQPEPLPEPAPEPQTVPLPEKKAVAPKSLNQMNDLSPFSDYAWVAIGGALSYERGLVDDVALVSKSASKVFHFARSDGADFLGVTNSLELPLNTDVFYIRNNFEMSLPLAQAAPKASGFFLHLSETVSAMVNEGKSVNFEINTSNGPCKLVCEAVQFSGTAPSDVMPETSHSSVTISEAWDAIIRETIDDFTFADLLF